MGSSDLNREASDGTAGDLENKTLMRSSSDRGDSSDGVRVLDEVEVLGEKLNSGSVNRGVKRNNFGYMDDKNDGSKSRVVELMSRDNGLGVMNLVGRVLNGNFGMDKEVGDGKNCENKAGINLVVDLNAWQDMIGEPKSANEMGNDGTVINKGIDAANVNSSCLDEANGLNGNQDLVTNEPVPDGKSEIEEVNISDTNIFNEKPTDKEKPGCPDEGTSLNGNQNLLTHEPLPDGKSVTDETNIFMDKPIDKEKPDCPNEGTSLIGKQNFITNEQVPAEKSVTGEVKNAETDILLSKAHGEPDICEKSREYFLSDLVWGKVRSHPWWPGQIFLPLAASDRAMKYFKEDCHLIAYFGDKTFAWNEGSNIKPFLVNFREMEKQSNMEGFSHAVSCAIDEVSRRVEVGLSCPCLPVDVCDKIKTQIVANTGIKDKLSKREDRDNSSTAVSFLPGEIVTFLESLGKAPKRETNRLQFAIRKAQLLGFKRWLGQYQLPVIEMCERWVEDKYYTQFTEKREGNDFKELIEGVVPASDAASEVPSKKRKSVVQVGSSQKRNRSTLSLQNNKKQTVKRQHSLTSSSTIDVMDLQTDKKPRFGEHICWAFESGDRSMGTSANSSDGKSKKLDRISDKNLTPENILTKLNLAAKKPMQGNNIMIQVVGLLREFQNSICLEKSSQTEQNGMNEGKQLLNTETTTDEIFAKLSLAAKHPMQGRTIIFQLLGLFHEFRNSICFEKFSPRSQTEQNGKKKRKQPLNTETTTDEFGFEGAAKDTYWTDRVIQSYSQPCMLFEPEAPDDTAADVDNKKEKDTVIVSSESENLSGMGNEVSEESNPTLLILNFTNLESIPSISRLNEIFRRYGPLNESDTKILSKSKRVKVIFKRKADAETAFSSTGKYSLFGPSLCSYRLDYVPTPRKAYAISKRNKKTAMKDYAV